MYACMYNICIDIFAYTSLYDVCVRVSNLFAICVLQACAFHTASRLVEMQQRPRGCRWGRPASAVILLIKVAMLTPMVSTKVRLSTEREGLWLICRSNCRQIDIDQKTTTVLLVCMYAWTHVCAHGHVCLYLRACTHAYI